jgi:hypothetical protein
MFTLPVGTASTLPMTLTANCTLLPTPPGWLAVMVTVRVALFTTWFTEFEADELPTWVATMPCKPGLNVESVQVATPELTG